MGFHVQKILESASSSRVTEIRHVVRRGMDYKRARGNFWGGGTTISYLDCGDGSLGDVYFQTDQRVHFKSEQLCVLQLYLNEVETEGSLLLALKFYLLLSFKFSVESRSVGSRGNLWSCPPLLTGSEGESERRES